MSEITNVFKIKSILNTIQQKYALSIYKNNVIHKKLIVKGMNFLIWYDNYLEENDLPYDLSFSQSNKILNIQ